ncbi:MAG: hypothetical protein AAGI92_02940 [Pseudomonadota bacterium]
MAKAPAHYTDSERARLRARLQAHAERYGLSAQRISDQITEKTGFAAADYGGQRRIARFLKENRKQPEDFIAAVEAYLNQVAPEGVEESAIAVARLFSQAQDQNADLSGLVGRYQAYLRPMRPASKAPPPKGIGSVPHEYFELPRPTFDIAYALIAMTPLERSNALLIADAVTNVAIDPEIDTFPENPIAISNSGVLMPFGISGFLMVTKSLLETRLYRLTTVSDEPLTLQGHLTFNGLHAATRRRHDLQIFDPDFEVELVKVTDISPKAE